MSAAPASATAAGDASTLWHVAVFRFAPNNVAKAVVALRTMRSASRTHSGNLSYEVYRSSEDPQSFFIIEQWESAAALAAHEATPVL